MGEVGKKGGVGRSNENIKKKGIQLCRLKEKESTQFNPPPPKKKKKKLLPPFIYDFSFCHRLLYVIGNL